MKLAGETVIQIYTGEGKGKTTAALGLCLRAIGRGKRACVVQFMKNRNTGEYLASEKLGLEMHPFGRSELVGKEPLPADLDLARRALEKAKYLAKTKPDILVLDELNVAIAFKLIPIEDAVKFVKSIPSSIEVVITGRYAPQELLDLADLVTEMREIKHPFASGEKAREGIEY